MKLNELLTEQQLDELDWGKHAKDFGRGLGAVAGTTAHVAGAVAGGVHGGIDAFKNGYNKGRANVSGNPNSKSTYTPNYWKSSPKTNNSVQPSQTNPTVPKGKSSIPNTSPTDDSNPWGKTVQKGGSSVPNVAKQQIPSIDKLSRTDLDQLRTDIDNRIDALDKKGEAGMSKVTDPNAVDVSPTNPKGNGGVVKWQGMNYKFANGYWNKVNPTTGALSPAPRALQKQLNSYNQNF